MLESEMVKKICPKMLCSRTKMRADRDTVEYEYSLCLGSSCGMWDEHTCADPSNTPYGRLPMDPPAGDCGLKFGTIEVEVV